MTDCTSISALKHSCCMLIWYNSGLGLLTLFILEGRLLTKSLFFEKSCLSFIFFSQLAHHLCVCSHLARHKALMKTSKWCMHWGVPEAHSDRNLFFIFFLFFQGFAGLNIFISTVKSRNKPGSAGLFMLRSKKSTWANVRSIFWLCFWTLFAMPTLNGNGSFSETVFKPNWRCF